METREELEQTVTMLEQILEVMSNDISTLKSLYRTHLQLGGQESALEVLARIEAAARSVRDESALDFVIEQYASVEHISSEMKERTAQLRAFRDAGEGGMAETTSQSHVFDAVPLDSEMTLAWDMLQDEQLTQDEYSEVVGDLTEMTAGNLGVPVTMLHVLKDRNFSRFERLMTHLSEKANVPIISLESFEENEEANRSIPIEFSCSRGALPFSCIGEELLVAVLNPFDQEVLAEVEKESGRVCHAYLVSPYEYDKRLGERKKAIVEKEKEEG